MKGMRGVLGMCARIKGVGGHLEFYYPSPAGWERFGGRRRMGGKEVRGKKYEGICTPKGGSGNFCLQAEKTRSSKKILAFWPDFDSQANLFLN